MNERLRTMLIRHEGYRNVPYADIKGIKTVGVGHNLVANPLHPDMAEYLHDNGEITDEMIELLFEHDVNVAMSECKALYHSFDDWTENRQNALMDWMFEVGLGTAKAFHTFNALVNTGNWSKAADDLITTQYGRQVPHRAAEICRLIREG